MAEVLTTHNLTKAYKGINALENINITIDSGQIYGLIGRNGAGKTTFMKIISGLARASSGSYTLFGKEKNDEDVAASVGSLIESPGFFDNLTAYENMYMKSCLYANAANKGKIENLLNLVDLYGVQNLKVKTFSLGMRQRLGIAMALIGNPGFIILDEPINGLDPQGIAEIRETIQYLSRERGITILISSHILDELARIATHYGIIERGHLIYSNSSDGIIEDCKKQNLTFEEFYFNLTGGRS